MFSKPEYGWTEVKIGEHYLGSASYIYEVITPTLSTLYNYLSKSIYENQSLNLVFDAEGHSFGIVQIEDDFYSWNDDNDEGQVELLVHAHEVGRLDFDGRLGGSGQRAQGGGHPCYEFFHHQFFSF